MCDVVFKDSEFEKAVREFLEITESTVTRGDLLKITGIKIAFEGGGPHVIPIPWQSTSTAIGMNIPNLYLTISETNRGHWESDLQHFSHIHSLHISVSTKDLSCLRGFNSLKELYVVDSSTKDWSFIPTLSSLNSLSVRNCNFSDLTPIRDLHVKQIEWSDQKREKGVLFFNDVLENVELINCGISDLTPLSDCKRIEELNLSHNNIVYISPLGNIEYLYYLTLRHNLIEDISPLRKLDCIYYINIRHNRVIDISSLRNFKSTNLSRLFLEDNPIVDFSPLRGIHLVAHDIDSCLYNKYRHEARMEESRREKPAELEHLLGKWSDSQLHFDNHDELILAFDENSKGFLIFGNEEYGGIYIFNWTIINGNLKVTDTKEFTFEDGKLVAVADSKLENFEVKVLRCKRQSLDGSYIQSLEFSKLFLDAFHETFGLVSRKIYDSERFVKLKEIIWGF